MQQNFPSVSERKFDVAQLGRVSLFHRISIRMRHGQERLVDHGGLTLRHRGSQVGQHNLICFEPVFDQGKKE